MTQSIPYRVWTWLHQTFPERQIYIRSEGRVQFFTVSVLLQVTLAGLTAIALAWIAFASVNVIFKDRIIAAKEHRYQDMQLAYERRIAERQIAYDDLNGTVIQAERRAHVFVAKARGRQTGFITRIALSREKMRNSAIQVFPPPADLQEWAGSPQNADGTYSRVATRKSIANIAISGLARVRRVLVTALKWFSKSRKWHSKAELSHPLLAGLTADAQELERLAQQATTLMESADSLVLQTAAVQRRVIARTGIDPIQFLRNVQSQEGIGGPEIPIDDVHVDGIEDRDFARNYLRGEADLARLSDLISVVGHLPLTVPVTTVVRTSGFGPRLDPFSGHYAFHPGIDFAGPSGAPVEATAPGIVTFAGRDGSYGNMVELDHGFGVRTRYAHLLAITVRQGARVTKGTIVGRLGSTGRSTGPHVHYEIWYQNVVRNPDNFIRAGHCRGLGC